MRVFFLEWELSSGVLEKLNKKICPKCGSEEFSLILQDKTSSNDSIWECSDCSFQCDPDDKINLFDFDQGFNLDEVYDQ